MKVKTPPFMYDYLTRVLHEKREEAKEEGDFIEAENILRITEFLERKLEKEEDMNDPPGLF